ncbi:hypothetical protein WA026_000592 [Henosepilachna vigintioctopunctata]|uniref:Tetratricopeptide repeat protein 36 n=1 Tax=Henosepilachna vigintioctopunctata TaxID=420089 RepID=A0AAW1V6H1_9CUCU
MELSSKDRAILNCVFNPHLPLDDAFNEKPDLQDEEESTEEILNAKKLEMEAVILAENAQCDEAIIKLNEAIAIAPNKASLYNNRAHTLQFQGKYEEALEDVNKSLELAKDSKLLKTLCQAHVQRGVLYRRKDDKENARKDFQIAAEMGDVFAKTQMVELNPYAALCNEMLRRVMETWK